MFYTTMTQKPNEYINEEGIKNLIPGYGLYFLAGKKGAKALDLFKEYFEALIRRSFHDSF